MIRCQNCGAENEVSSIFCRTCSEKLDHSSLTPETFERKEHTGLRTVTYVVGRLAILAVLFAAIWFMVLLILPATEFRHADVAIEDARKVGVLYGQMFEPAQKFQRYTLTSEEATLLVNAAVGLDFFPAPPTPMPPVGTPIHGRAVPDYVHIEFGDDSDVHMVLRSRLPAGIPRYSTLDGRLTFVAGTGFRFEPSLVKIGRIALPPRFQHIVLDQFQALVDSAPLSRRLSQLATELEIGRNKVRIILKPRE